jgi:hypothetical protein
MKKLTTLVLIMVGVVALADTAHYVMTTEAPSTNATASVNEWPVTAVEGQAKLVSIKCETNVTVSVVTKAGHGGSKPAERTVMGATAIAAPGLTTNLTSGIWMHGDVIEARFTNSSNAVQTVRVGLITAD